MFRFSILLALMLGIVMIAPTAKADEVLSDLPASPDASARYLFYMHGGYVEKRGGGADYHYADILDALAAKGLVVIGEERGQIGNPMNYVPKVVGQVTALLDGGVPAENITVAGHSKGGLISLVTASRLGNASIKFGIMAACGQEASKFGRPYNKFIKRGASRIKGRFLAAWAKDDDVAGNCDRALDKAGVPYENKILPAGKGHRLFYTPDPLWIDLLAAYAKG